jgi:hypothetical protein
MTAPTIAMPFTNRTIIRRHITISSKSSFTFELPHILLLFLGVGCHWVHSVRRRSKKWQRKQIYWEEISTTDPTSNPGRHGGEPTWAMARLLRSAFRVSRSAISFRALLRPPVETARACSRGPAAPAILCNCYQIVEQTYHKSRVCRFHGDWQCSRTGWTSRSHAKTERCSHVVQQGACERTQFLFRWRRNAKRLAQTRRTSWNTSREP